MSRDTLSGAALVLGAAAGLVTMALHPSAVDHSGTPEHLATVMRLNVIAHGLAILAMAVTLFGALGLARRLGDTTGLADAGVVAFAFAAFAASCAAVASGLIAPALIEHLADASEAERSALGVVGDYSWFFNQAFAKVHVVASSVAIALWSLAILRGRSLPRWLGWYGCVLGPLALLALFSGRLQLDVHGFGLIVLTQGVWLVGSGVSLWSARPATA